MTDFQRDKTRVADSFSRAAASYDAAAELQREIGLELLAKIPADLTPVRILDLGSGTGFFAAKLAERFPEAEIICLDLAEGMLQFSRAERGVDALHLCADAEQLPLASGSIDLVFSSLAIQWCENLPQLFAELARVMSSGACARMATLGPNTLAELRSAWSQVDDYVHVNRFAGLMPLMRASSVAGLAGFDVEIERRVLKYQKLSDFTRELKAIGAHNVNRGHAPGLTGRARLAAFKQAYESFRGDDGLLPATYEIFYLCIEA